MPRHGATRIDDLYSIDPHLPAFDERNIMFRRALWDSPIMDRARLQDNALTNHIVRGRPGFSDLDYALMTAAWSVVEATNTDTGIGARSGLYVNRTASHPAYATGSGLPAPRPLPPAEATRLVKKVARYLGADLVGITETDPRWFYSRWFSRQGEGRIEFPSSRDAAGLDADAAGPGADATGLGADAAGAFHIPAGMKWVIVVAVRQDIATTRGGSTLLAGAATGQGYLKMALVTHALAEFLAALGYQALPSGNDLALSEPLAIAAGLGELGRNGLLVTPGYGPNVRLAKVFTSLPLAADRPRDFGVRKFCRVCKKCADHCPSKAIANGEMTREPACPSNNPGVLKWPVDVERCYKFWNVNGSGCSTCVAVCPYTKDSAHHWHHALAARLAPVAPRVLVWLDDLLGYGVSRPGDWWGER